MKINKRLPKFLTDEDSASYIDRTSRNFIVAIIFCILILAFKSCTV